MRFLSILAAVWVAGCAHAPEPVRPVTAASFWPLQVGNRWTWLDISPALATTGASRTVRIVGKTADGFFRDNTGAELRIGHSCIEDRSRRLLCAPFEVGNRWSSVVSVASTERYEIAGVNETVSTPAGRFSGCVRVRATNRAAGADSVLEMTYAPGVGPIKIETFAVLEGKVSEQVKAVLSAYEVGK